MRNIIYQLPLLVLLEFFFWRGIRAAVEETHSVRTVLVKGCYSPALAPINATIDPAQVSLQYAMTNPDDRRCCPRLCGVSQKTLREMHVMNFSGSGD